MSSGELSLVLACVGSQYKNFLHRVRFEVLGSFPGPSEDNGELALGELSKDKLIIEESNLDIKSDIEKDLTHDRRHLGNSNNIKLANLGNPVFMDDNKLIGDESSEKLNDLRKQLTHDRSDTHESSSDIDVKSLIKSLRDSVRDKSLSKGVKNVNIALANKLTEDIKLSNELDDALGLLTKLMNGNNSDEELWYGNNNSLGVMDTWGHNSPAIFECKDNLWNDSHLEKAHLKAQSIIKASKDVKNNEKN